MLGAIRGTTLQNEVEEAGRARAPNPNDGREDERNLLPAWTSDGAGITYLSNAEGEYSHYTVAADGSGQPRALLPKPHGACGENRAAWSPDGEHVVFAMRAGNQQADMDLWVLSASSRSAAVGGCHCLRSSNPRGDATALRTMTPHRSSGLAARSCRTRQSKH